MTKADVSALTDAELAAAAGAGAEPAYRELVRRYERPVFNFVRRMVGDPALAEDLTQEAFLKAFTRLDSFDRSRKFSAWLFSIAHHSTLDCLRRRRLDTVGLDDAVRAGSLSEAGDRAPTDERLALAEALDAALNRLRLDYRDIVVLRYQEGFSYDEIAGIIGQPLGTVKTALHRARKELAADLSRQGWKGPS